MERRRSQRILATSTPLQAVIPSPLSQLLPRPPHSPSSLARSSSSRATSNICAMIQGLSAYISSNTGHRASTGGRSHFSASITEIPNVSLTEHVRKRSELRYRAAGARICCTYNPLIHTTHLLTRAVHAVTRVQQRLCTTLVDPSTENSPAVLLTRQGVVREHAGEAGVDAGGARRQLPLLFPAKIGGSLTLSVTRVLFRDLAELAFLRVLVELVLSTPGGSTPAAEREVAVHRGGGRRFSQPVDRLGLAVQRLRARAGAHHEQVPLPP